MTGSRAWALVFVLFAAFAPAVLSSGDDDEHAHEGHGHEEHGHEEHAHDEDAHDEHAHKGAFEWAGIFETPENTYLWTAQKTVVGDTIKYVDASMKMVALPAASATDAALHSLESEGAHGLSLNCTDVHSGDIITPMEDVCYRLVFKQDQWQSLYTINTAGVSNVAFFAEHVPVEFENTAHYLKDDHGDDIEPVAELPEEQVITVVAPKEEEKSYWGEAIGTAIIVNLITLVGVILMVPVVSRAAVTYANEFECIASGFAAGAISACAFFLLLFESTHLIATEHTEEVDTLWRWGTMILAGALFPVVAHNIAEFAIPQQPQEKQLAADAEKADAETAPTLPHRVRLVTGILIGDFMHNLCDGFFVGAAFKGCGSTFGWTVASGTIAHEIAQELADYVVLTGKDCALRPLIALALNFLSGTSVLLGAVIVLSVDVSDGDIGLLLAFGGGTYLYIAFVQCMSKLQSVNVTAMMRSWGIFAFVIGAVAIGLVLLDHEHCVPPPPPGVVEAPKKGGHHH